MLTSLCLLVAAGGMPPGDETPKRGSISGMVVNASQENAPVGGAEVALRVLVDGQFVIAGETKTDGQGRFSFDNVPADPDYVYLPGASWETVHYSGERLRLDSRQRHVDVQIPVRDVVKTPNPLTVRDHRITVETEQNALRVTESLLVVNPGQSTYGGQPSGASTRAATLTLSIPPNFTRVTFHKEFYGRRFVVIDGKLVTDIPWEPGGRELKFTYVLPRSEGQRAFERPLDLPTSRLLVTIPNADANQVTCNAAPTEHDDHTAVAFASEQLPAGHVLRVDFGRLPVALAAFAPWGAFVIVVGLIGTTFLILKRPSSP